MALILRRPKTIPMNTVVVTGSHTTLLAVPDVALLALTRIRAMGVVTHGMFVAVVKSEPALVDVRALRVRPSRVGHRHVEHRGARDVGAGEISLCAGAINGVLVRVAPAAAHAPQTCRALRLRLTGFTLAGFARDLVSRRGRPVEPLATQPELVLASVDAEAEALACGLAPDAAAALVEAVLAVETQAARRGALAGVHYGATRPPAASAPRLVRPPLTVVPGDAALAADVV